MRNSLHPLALALASTLKLVFVASVASASPAAVRLDVALAHPVLQAGHPQTNHLRVGLMGQQLGQQVSRNAAQAPGGPTTRAPANVCLAIDRSGSMAGEKLESARRGAVAALAHLRSDDVVSVVAYDDVVRVIVPATQASDRGAVERGILQLTPGGGTALFAGVVKCAGEVRKGLSPQRVNRIILLSDGFANSGPSSPAELGSLGAELAAEGISVATVGLGLDYNEDLMAELALRSDGKHIFVQRPADLTRFLAEELDAVAAVVANNVKVTVRFAPGTKPLRVLGRPADIVGNTVSLSFGKIYAAREHFFVVEMQVDEGQNGSTRQVADVSATFRDLVSGQDAKNNAANATNTMSKLNKTEEVKFSRQDQDVTAAANPGVLSELSLLQADEATLKAIRLRDQGDVTQARQVLEQNASSLAETSRLYQDARVGSRLSKARDQAKNLSPSPAGWNAQRKSYRQDSLELPLNGL
jgi:Ca-activated chloride channel family protein